MVTHTQIGALGFMFDGPDLIMECSADELEASSESSMQLLRMSLIQGEPDNPATPEFLALWTETMAENMSSMLGGGDWETAIIQGNQGSIVLSKGILVDEELGDTAAMVGLTGRIIDGDVVVAMLIVTIHGGC